MTSMHLTSCKASAQLDSKPIGQPLTMNESKKYLKIIMSLGVLNERNESSFEVVHARNIAQPSY